jgi:hypothetical protein
MIVKHGASANPTQGTLIGSGNPTEKNANCLTLHTTGYDNTFWGVDYVFGDIGAVTGSVVAVTYDGSYVTGYVNGTASAPFALTGYTNAAAQQFIGFNFRNSFFTAPNCTINYAFIFGISLPAADRSILAV